MAGTGGSIASSGGGIMLPAPKLQAYIPASPQAVFMAEEQPSGGNTVQVVPMRYLKVTVPGIPAAILADTATYAPLVELLVFRRLETRENGASGNGTKTSGFVHPSHGPGASSNANFTHGGQHSGVAGTVQALRPTEWPIVNGNDAIDVSQGILGFMCLGQIGFRDSSGNLTNTAAVYPASRCNLAKRLRVSGRRFPYSSIMIPGYFAFRLSIIDPSDARGKRIHGPMSQQVSCTTTKFPFVPAGLDVGGRAQADLAPGFDPKQINFWLGATSRLPG